MSEQSEIFKGLAAVIRLTLANRRLIIWFTLGVMALVTIYVYILPNRYTSRASILPSGKKDSFATLKQLAGVSGSAIDFEENSSALFPEILKSDQVRNAVVEKEFTYNDDGETKTFSFPEKYNTENKEILREALAGMTKVTADQMTGIISITVTTNYPNLSQKILQQVLQELDNYNLNIRRSQAKESERYLARELAAKEKELDEAEAGLEQFRQANQNWYMTSDPGIMTTMGRLQRNIEIITQNYMLLREQYELTRLNVQRDIPVVNLLDPPSYPHLKSGPRRKMIIGLTGIFSFMAIFGYILLREAYRKARSGPNAGTLSGLESDFVRAIPVVNRLFLKRRQEQAK